MAIQSANTVPDVQVKLQLAVELRVKVWTCPLEPESKVVAAFEIVIVLPLVTVVVRITIYVDIPFRSR